MRKTSLYESSSDENGRKRTKGEQKTLYWNTRTYLTRPDVFLRTVAANSCETPTKLTPSTSTIWSFTWILRNTHTYTHKTKETCPLFLLNCFICSWFYAFFWCCWSLFADWSISPCQTLINETWNAPSILLRRSSFSDRLDKDSQFLQSLVSSYTHSNDADPQTLIS